MLLLLSLNINFCPSPYSPCFWAYYASSLNNTVNYETKYIIDKDNGISRYYRAVARSENLRGLVILWWT